MVKQGEFGPIFYQKRKCVVYKKYLFRTAKIIQGLEKATYLCLLSSIFVTLYILFAILKSQVA